MGTRAEQEPGLEGAAGGGAGGSWGGVGVIQHVFSSLLGKPAVLRRVLAMLAGLYCPRT